METNYILVNKNDNVIVTLKEYTQGEKLTIDNFELTIQSDIPVGHKIAIKKINQNAAKNFVDAVAKVRSSK
ncbi:hypothetical protein [Alkalihalobacillus sp. BA299]|uniref:hypothetical protein n=1 Tax=Alkalihalobacillus sp. BA299 TaxID=2815938 RepID=UPI001ADBD2EC|nr:hypothetical protein [Alkalihalobacillus sp. BA299]